MARPKNEEECLRLTIYLPISILAKLELLCWDPVREKPSLVNSKSALIEKLLREHFTQIGIK